MTPREFLEAVVRLDVAEFSDEYGSIRRAYHAVTAVDALAAHIFVWCRTNAPSEVTGLHDNHYRGKLSQRSSEFRLLRDIAKAQKHVHLERGKPGVTKAAQVVARTFGWGEGGFGQGRFGGPPQVVVTMDSGDLRYVEQIVIAALGLLEAEMTRLKI